MAALEWKYYIVYTCWIAFEFVYLYFTVIETKGKNGPLPLEEIAVLFDKDNQSADISGAGIGGPESPQDYSADVDKKDAGDFQVENSDPEKRTTTLV